MQEDKIKLLYQLYQRNSLELFALIRKYADQKERIASSDGRLELERAQLEELITLLKNQKRELDFHAGEKVEPVQHTAEVVLLGASGMGSA
jgi:hypothetical protein